MTITPEIRETLERMARANYKNNIEIGDTLISPAMNATVTGVEYIETHHTHEVTIDGQKIGYGKLDKIITAGQIKLVKKEG